MDNFLFSRNEQVVALAQTYRLRTSEDGQDAITVTLIPLVHSAHPAFFKQVDDLCCQHDSVLMEGRTPITGAPYSTVVPPRERTTRVRPVDHEDDEGWEPIEMEAFFQPFSWGVADSPNHTVVHAADKYDYEKLPWWCSVRFNAPVLGSLAREKHCLDMIFPLRGNQYKSFAIPWGAAHIPIFHEMLVDNGFELVAMSALVVVRRIDGNVSEGMHDRIVRAVRRRQRAWSAVRFVAGVVIVWAILSSFRVERRKDE